MNRQYLTPSQEAGAELFSRGWQGEVTMLNLLRFKSVADYSQYPQLAENGDISGFDAFQKYIALTKPLLEQTGGELLMVGNAGQFLIGPSSECWDLVMLVKQRSLQDFLSFATNPDYQAIIGHREAAILDSRLLPFQLIG